MWVEENLVTQVFFAKNAINLRICLNIINLLKLRCTAVGRERMIERGKEEIKDDVTIIADHIVVIHIQRRSS